MTLTFDPLRAMVMTYSHAKVQGQWSIGSEDRVETNERTDGQTDGGDCITSLANAVDKNATKRASKNVIYRDNSIRRELRNTTMKTIKTSTRSTRRVTRALRWELHSLKACFHRIPLPLPYCACCRSQIPLLQRKICKKIRSV